MFHDIENVLVLAPHTDDGELGLGGTINKYSGRICSRGISKGYFENRGEKCNFAVRNKT